ncbi:uncharacterized protein LOC142344099 [Convolutriloba macropyga]|uniref:uncharacterized protein LOC142344099 n=1 Tax=Convolutriloba macropyga TaxID=536237 RepID=UPI003F51C32E
MTNVFSLITSLIFFVVMAPTLCVGGGSHLCNNDYDCEWYMAFLQDDDKPEGTSCCTDDRCHESCDWETFWFVMVFIILPLIVCICCAGIIGLVVYCAVKQANAQNSQQVGVVYNTGGAYPYPPVPAPTLPSYQGAQNDATLSYSSPPTYAGSSTGAAGQAAPLPPKPTVAGDFGFVQG